MRSRSAGRLNLWSDSIPLGAQSKGKTQIIEARASRLPAFAGARLDSRIGVLYDESRSIQPRRGLGSISMIQGAARAQAWCRADRVHGGFSDPCRDAKLGDAPGCGIPSSFRRGFVFGMKSSQWE